MNNTPHRHNKVLFTVSFTHLWKNTSLRVTPTGRFSLRRPIIPILECHPSYFHTYHLQCLAGELAHPDKQKTLIKCWFNVGPPSTTVAQHLTNIGSMSHVCWDVRSRQEILANILGWKTTRQNIRQLCVCLWCLSKMALLPWLQNLPPRGISPPPPTDWLNPSCTRFVCLMRGKLTIFKF